MSSYLEAEPRTSTLAKELTKTTKTRTDTSTVTKKKIPVNEDVYPNNY